MPVITFDFDNTIAMSHMKIIDSDEKPEYVFDEYNQKTIELINHHMDKDDEVYIVTSRFEDKEGMYPNDTIEKHLEKLSLRWFFWPNRVFYTNGAPKREKLVELGTTIHYDDDMQEHVDGLPEDYVVKNPYDFYEDVRLAGKALIFDSEDRLLVLRRTDEGKKWDLPGGHIKTIEYDRGPEGIKEGTMREVAEETGLILPFLTEMGHHTFVWKGRDSEIAFFMSKIDDITPPVNLFMQEKQENDNYEWKTLDELFKYVRNGTQVLRKGVEMVKSVGILSENERFQHAMKAKHRKMKKKLVGLGGNTHFGGGKGHSRPKMSRSESAPAGFGVLEEENEDKNDKIKVKIVQNMDEKRKKKRKNRTNKRKKTVYPNKKYQKRGQNRPKKHYHWNVSHWVYGGGYGDGDDGGDGGGGE